MGQPAPHAERMVPIGRVVKTHGLAGDILVYPYLPDLAFYPTMPRVLIYRDDGQSQSPAVRHASVVGERIRLHLEGYDSLTTVQPLVGRDLHVPRGDLPPVGEHDYYWYDLVGLSVYTDEGALLGSIVDFFPTGSNQVLVVRDGEREILLPFIKDVIMHIDTTQGRVDVRAIPGLF